MKGAACGPCPWQTVRMLEFLESTEPYASYRFLIGLVLTGLTFYWLVTALGSIRGFRAFLRDMNRHVDEDRFMNEARKELDPNFDTSTLPPLRSKPGKIIKLAVYSACLRLLSWRTLRNVWPDLLGIAILAPLCIYAYWWVFTAEV